MNDLFDPSRPPLSRLLLQVVFPPDGSDHPHLVIAVDGVDLARLPGAPEGYFAHPIDDILTPPVVAVSDLGWSERPSGESPLLQEAARRVALYTCSCGIAGCGVIAPVIATDGEVVSWTDFRTFTGLFDRPDDAVPEHVEGRPFEMAQVRFDRDQYEAEVARAATDRSWESPSRVTARILRAMLLQHEDRILDAGFRLGWLSPVYWNDVPGRVEFSLDPLGGGSNYVVSIGAKFGTPFSRARSMLDRLLEHPVAEWYRRFPVRR